MKTIRDWIQTLPADIRRKAMVRPNYKYIAWNKVHSLERAIFDLNWGRNRSYWEDVYERAGRGEFEQTTPKEIPPPRLISDVWNLTGIFEHTNDCQIKDFSITDSENVSIY